jgi:hypothetical protein
MSFSPILRIIEKLKGRGTRSGMQEAESYHPGAAAALAVLASLFLSSVAPPPASALQTEHDIPAALTFVHDSSMRADIQALQDFGTRFALSPGVERVALWIAARLRDAGLTDVEVDSFPLGEGWQYNVIGTLPGASASGTIIVVGAHHDSYSSIVEQAPGADDNASGVSAVLETARALMRSGLSTQKTVRFCTFGAEELGLLGSADYARRARARNEDICAMLNFDMIGHRRADQPDRHVNIVWYAGHETLARIDSQTARLYTSLEPRFTSAGRNASDSYSFVREGYAAVFMIEADFNPFYHSPSDVLDTLDMEYAADIVRARLALLLTLDAGIDTTRRPPQEVPGMYTLLPNYPNPFNAGTFIVFNIKTPTVLQLSVFSLLGAEVAVLADGAYAPGLYTRRWDATGCASGIYLARLRTGDGSTQAIRLLLVR